MDQPQRFGIRVGTTSRVSGYMLFEEPVFIKDHCYVRHSDFGAFTYVGDHSTITSTITGRYCSIGPGCRINPGRHPTDQITTSATIYNDPFWWYRDQQSLSNDDYNSFPTVVIGNDVWIGANSIIMSGIRIGDGAIIGAGSTVTRDVSPYTIVAGVPARIIRPRFQDDIVSRLLKLQWWRFDLPQWSKRSDTPLFRSIDHSFLDQIERSIEGGHASMIENRKCKVSFVGTQSKIERVVDDASWLNTDTQV